MRVLISGLDESACAALFNVNGTGLGASGLGGTGLQAQLQWLAPELFIQRAEGQASDGSAQAVDRWVWLYRAPLALDDQSRAAEPDSGDLDASDRLTRWYRQPRAALALRRTLGPRLLLVNAERVDGAALALELGSTGAVPSSPGPQGGRLPSWLSPDAIGQGLARLFDSALPQYWDLFEDLEAAAWLPRGEPLFRQVLQPASQEAIARLLGQIEQGLLAPGLRARAAEQDAAVARPEAAQQETGAALDVSSSAWTRLARRRPSGLASWSKGS